METRNRSKTNALKMAIESLEQRTLMSAGALDTSFGSGGQAALPAGTGGSYNALVMPIAVDSTGRILVANTYFDGHFTSADVQRLNTNGTVDKTFGTNGTFEDSVPGGGVFPYSEYINQIIPEFNGSVLLIGASIQRLTAAGTLDSTFKATTATSMSAGVLLAGGQLLTVDGSDGNLYQFNTNGSAVSTYGKSGVLALPSPYSAVAIDDIKLDSSGRPVLSVVVKLADSTIVAGTARLTATGMLDTTYGTGGFALTTTPMAGTYVTNLNSKVAIAPDGSVDQLVSGGGTSFLFGYFKSGKSVTGGQPSLPGPYGDLNDLVVQSDGKIVVTGNNGIPNVPSSLTIDRFNPITAGGTQVTFDTTFNGSGTLWVKFPGGGGVEPDGKSVALDSTGRILVTSVDSDTSTDSVLRVIAGGTATTPTDPLTGTAIGTAGSYQNKGNTTAKAFDGNLSTFFDAPGSNGNWVGLDLGTARTIAAFSFAPRAGFAARMIGGMIQGSTSADFSTGVQTLYTITSSPVVGTLTTVGVGNVGPFQYVRYVGPAGSYGNIAELKFFGSPQPLGGGVIGTAGSYQNQGNNIYNTNNGTRAFFDAPTASGAWVGRDYGVPVSLTEVSYAPRDGWPGFAQRMVGGQFQASNTADFSSGVVTVLTVTTAPPADRVTTVAISTAGSYRYWRYIGPNGGYCNISLLEFEG